jgi:hypothetical protein
VVGPLTLLTALAYYFGWRRERAFAGYFGIDPTVLGLSSDDYVLRSVEALFAPFAALLLVCFAVLCARVLLADAVAPRWVSEVAAIVGIAALAIGVALAAGHGISSSYIYLQALAPAVGVSLVAYALIEMRKHHHSGADRASVSGLRYLTLSVILVSLFWATAEYADHRGTNEARKLAANLAIDPTVTLYSKENLDIDPSAYAATKGCPVVNVQKNARSDYPWIYSGFTLLLRNDGDYFITPTPPDGVWTPRGEPVLIIPDNDSIRVEFERGASYPVRAIEKTFSSHLAFTC